MKTRKSTQRLQAQHYATAQFVVSLRLVLFSKLLLPFYSLTLHASFQKNDMPCLLCAILSYYLFCPQLISSEHFLPPFLYSHTLMHTKVPYRKSLSQLGPFKDSSRQRTSPAGKAFPGVCVSAEESKFWVQEFNQWFSVTRPGPPRRQHPMAELFYKFHFFRHEVHNSSEVNN